MDVSMTCRTIDPLASPTTEQTQCPRCPDANTNSIGFTQSKCSSISAVIRIATVAVVGISAVAALALLKMDKPAVVRISTVAVVGISAVAAVAIALLRKKKNQAQPLGQPVSIAHSRDRQFQSSQTSRS